MQDVPHHIILDRQWVSITIIGAEKENLRRMNHFEKFNKAVVKIVLHKMLGFISIMCLFCR